jgi:5'-3' exonuclease
MTKLTAIIDADILIYAASSAAEKPVNWGEGMWTLHAYEQEAINLFNEQYDRIMEKTGATESIMCISCASSEGWRKVILPSYKEHRAKVRPPMLREFMKGYVLENFKSFARPTLEGDDIFGILMTHPKLIEGDKIGCTIDKDMKTIPGKHYNFGKDEFFEIDEHHANYWHMLQTLTGDTTDGYSGCPKYGPKTAEKLLMEFVHETKYDSLFDIEEAWPAIVKAFDKAGLGEEEALTQARVARICRHTDYNYSERQVILWTPPSIK